MTAWSNVSWVQSLTPLGNKIFLFLRVRTLCCLYRSWSEPKYPPCSPESTVRSLAASVGIQRSENSERHSAKAVVESNKVHLVQDYLYFYSTTSHREDVFCSSSTWQLELIHFSKLKKHERGSTHCKRWNYRFPCFRCRCFSINNLIITESDISHSRHLIL